MKFALLMVLAVLAWWFIRRMGRDAAAPPPAGPAEKKDALDHEPMVACAHCQVHVPQGEAHRQGEHVFCSEAHRLAFSEAHPPP